MPHVRSGAVVTVVADSRRQGLVTPAFLTDMRPSYRREATADFDEDLHLHSPLLAVKGNRADSWNDCALGICAQARR